MISTYICREGITHGAFSFHGGPLRKEQVNGEQRIHAGCRLSLNTALSFSRTNWTKEQHALSHTTFGMSQIFHESPTAYFLLYAIGFHLVKLVQLTSYAHALQNCSSRKKANTVHVPICVTPGIRYLIPIHWPSNKLAHIALAIPVEKYTTLRFAFHRRAQSSNLHHHKPIIFLKLTAVPPYYRPVSNFKHVYFNQVPYLKL